MLRNPIFCDFSKGEMDPLPDPLPLDPRMTREKLALLHANNKGAYHPVHPRSRISAFVIRYLESKVVNMLHTKLVYVAEKTLESGLVGNPEIWFSRVEAHLVRFSHCWVYVLPNHIYELNCFIMVIQISN